MLFALICLTTCYSSKNRQDNHSTFLSQFASAFVNHVSRKQMIGVTKKINKTIKTILIKEACKYFGYSSPNLFSKTRVSMRKINMLTNPVVLFLPFHLCFLS